MRAFGGCHRVIEKEIGAVEERSGEKGVGVKKRMEDIECQKFKGLLILVSFILAD